MEMAKVIRCGVNSCIYNMDHCCHTIAITVGDGDQPRCDTFWHSTLKGGYASSLAGVGSCKVSACRYNTKYECQALGITVGYCDREPFCLSFELK